MAGYNVLHGGGDGSGPVVGTSSTMVLPRQDGTPDFTFRRAYALISASADNTAKIFLLLKNPPVGGGPSPVAAVNTGIVLNPGDAYEISRGNLYQGEVQAIATAPGQQLYIQLGS
jgi:hypothetical protein